MKNKTTDKPTKDIIKYIRILKELGVYKVWEKNRIKHVNNKSRFTSTPIIPNANSFSQFINRSFCWVETEVDYLWVYIYNLYEVVGIECDLQELEKYKETLKKQGLYKPKK